MNHRLPKTFVISLLSFVLLYYGTAWAVLRCVHEEDHSDHAIAIAGGEMYGNYTNRLSPVHSETHIDCLKLAYHTESLAGPSPSPQLQRWEGYVSSYPADFLTSPNVTEDSAEHPSLRAVFERSPVLIFLPYSPFYLSLSILRV